MFCHANTKVFLFLIALFCLSACAGRGLDTGRQLQSDSRLKQEGLKLFAKTKYELAFEAFQEAAEQGPENGALYYNMGLCLSRLGQPAEAIEYYTKALSFDQNLIQPLVSRGWAYSKLEKYDQALVEINRALRQNPDDPKILYNFGAIYLQMGKYDQAIKYYGLCLEQDQTMAQAFNNRGICFLKKTSYDLARKDFSKAHALRSKNPDYLFNRGLANEADHAFDEAISDYSMALDRNPDHAPALYNRGCLFYNLGNKERGCQDLARACDLGLCSRFHKLQESGECKEYGSQ